MGKSVFKGWKLFFLGLIGGLFNINRVLAQVMPDMTLGGEQSRITSTNLIEGGARRGENLFHSFQQFNISNGESVQFANPQDITTIFNRVTGGTPSHLNGTLSVNGNANLYFINPAGIIFGPNVQLDISGSFIASTANALTFGEAMMFSAVAPQPVSPLLQINVPVGLQFGTGIASDIRSSGQLIVGENLNLSAGSIDISGIVFAEGNIALQAQNQILIDGGFVVTSALHPELINDININANQLQLRAGGFIRTITETGLDGGSININTPILDISNGASIETFTFGPGDAGGINVNTSMLSLRDGARIVSISDFLSSGNSGNITLNASKTIQLLDARESISGEIDINSGQLVLFDPLTEIAIFTLGSGQGGRLDINTSELMIQGGMPVVERETMSPLLDTQPALIRLINVDSGRSGELVVDSHESINLLGGILTTEARGTGNAAPLSVNTSKLLVQNGAQISSNTFGAGQGGTLTISASDIQLIETRQNINSSAGFIASTIGSGDAGELIVNTNTLNIQGGAQITSSALIDLTDLFGDLNNNGQIDLDEQSNLGNGGQIEINASQDVLIVGSTTRATPSDDPLIRSGIFTATEGPGEAGEIIIRTPLLQITEQARISAENRGIGSGGILDIQAELITLDNQASIVSTTNSQLGGNINLSVTGLLLLRNNSFITTSAEEVLGSGNGGNVFIDAGVVVALPNENSDITTEASLGSGGIIQINTQGLFGFAIDNQSPLFSGISANSEFGADGQVEISSFNSLTAGLVTLPEIFAATTPFQNCQNSEIAAGSQLITGLARTPPGLQEIGHQDVWEDLRPIVSHRPLVEPGSYGSFNGIDRALSQPIIEAQGWQLNADGAYVLMVRTQRPTFNEKMATGPHCHQL